jgi:hypothetical protein
MTGIVLPGQHWTVGGRAGVLFAALLAAGLANALMASSAKVMKATGGVGIVPFEFIGSWDRAEPLVARWRTVDRGRGWRAARWSVWVDFAFIAAYALGLAVLAGLIASHALGGRDWPGYARLATVAGWGFVVAGGADVVEDVSLLRVLHGDRSADWPRLAAVAGGLKFALLLLGGLALLVVTLAFLART